MNESKKRRAKFTKQHYEAIAAVINAVGASGLFVGDSFSKTKTKIEAINTVARRIACMFALDNPKFDAEKFMRKCGWE